MRLALSSLFAALALCLAGCAPAEREERGPLVLAAASLQESMEAAADEWATAGHPAPVLSFAATSALARQIEAGAAGDLFVSADEKWMDEIVKAGLATPGTQARFLTNRLVLVAPASAQAKPLTIYKDLRLAEALGDGRLAMADPEAVPAGRYGKQALVSLGLWGAVSARIASAENVRAALALVGRGEAPLGIVYATDAQAEPKVRVVGTFPPNSHAPIVYPIVRLKASQNPEAEAFRHYLLSDEGKAIFRRYGFGTD